mgnify:FL=1
MKRTAAVLLALVALGMTGCGDDEGVAATAAPPASSPTSAAVTPTAVGDQVGDLYLAAFDDVVGLLADRPEAAAAETGLAALKQQYVEALVALGYQREGFDAVGRAVVDDRITAALGQLPAATYDAYQGAYAYYSDDPDVAGLISSFNIIGQYANFDLLWQQAPEEAERLGIPRR